MTTKLTTLLFGFSLVFGLMGCKASKAASTAANQASFVADASTSAAAAKVTKIVFVGKEHPCECTRKTIDGSWAVLQKVLGMPAKLPVERLQVDTQGAQVEPYRRQNAIMALPAVYFLDGRGTAVAFLQGEITEEQVGSILAKR